MSGQTNCLPVEQFHRPSLIKKRAEENKKGIKLNQGKQQKCAGGVGEKQQKCGGGGGGKTKEMQWWWWRDNNKNLLFVVGVHSFTIHKAVLKI